MLVCWRKLASVWSDPRLVRLLVSRFDISVFTFAKCQCFSIDFLDYSGLVMVVLCDDGRQIDNRRGVASITTEVLKITFSAVYSDIPWTWLI